MLDEQDTKLGAVETWQHAQACADLFRRHRDRIDGVLVCLPNFGDEKGVADALRLSALNVPVLVQASPGRSQPAARAAPPRRLLRQDLGLQQPAAVRHSVHADRAAHRRADHATNSSGS